jgi:hypothetical protein
MQAKVRECREKADQATDTAERERLLGMARSYLLLAMNAAWIASTDEFLRAIENRWRWPQPRLAEGQRVSHERNFRDACPRTSSEGGHRCAGTSVRNARHCPLWETNRTFHG